MNRVISGLLLVVSVTTLFSCARTKPVTDDVNGDVSVQIAMYESEAKYKLQVVKLKSIQKFNDVSGAYARFFFSPGAAGNQLTGVSPRARFAKSGDFFTPLDYISMQMVSLYYHLQSLVDLDREVGTDGVNQGPIKVAIETQVTTSKESILENNAFYNGKFDAMMFVPYTNQKLPISVNAGIIAHEYFHSLFYKLVLEALPNLSPESHQNSSESKIAATQDANQVFNQVLLRGMNEGLADFWGWVYTGDPEFMQWSLLSGKISNRSLEMPESEHGKFESDKDITAVVQSILPMSAKKQDDEVINYSYEIGTYYARFLKTLSVLHANEKGKSLSEGKKEVARQVVEFIKTLPQTVNSNLSESKKIDPAQLFKFFDQAARRTDVMNSGNSSLAFIEKYLKNSASSDPTTTNVTISELHEVRY